MTVDPGTAAHLGPQQGEQRLGGGGAGRGGDTVVTS